MYPNGLECNRFERDGPASEVAQHTGHGIFQRSNSTESLFLKQRGRRLPLHQTCESANLWSTAPPLSFSVSHLIPYLTQALMLHDST